MALPAAELSEIDEGGPGGRSRADFDSGIPHSGGNLMLGPCREFTRGKHYAAARAQTTGFDLIEFLLRGNIIGIGRAENRSRRQQGSAEVRLSHV